MKTYIALAAGLALFAATADAKPKRTAAAKKSATSSKKVSARVIVDPKKTGRKPEKVRGRAKRARRHPTADLGPASGQSIGAPWYGRLQDPSQLPDGDRYVIRRPLRSFGTHEAVDLTKQVVDQILEDFPDAHPLAIGDMSAEHGGQISQHASHQSGRDIDMGLFYNKKPTAYPADFVGATAENLDMATTFAMVDAFADTADEDGGVQMMFLDYRVQGLLYEWAKDHEVEVEHLDHLFEYPNGKGSSGIVRHEPNHDNHLHVRFKCPKADTGCVY